MRRLLTGLLAVAVTASLTAQTPQPRPRRPVGRGPFTADTAEAAVKASIEQVGELKKVFDRDIEVLRHIRAADAALTDPMQPNNAIEKAHDAMTKAGSLNPEFLVAQGVVRTLRALEDARRSPVSTDFGRLRSILKEHAEGPASRLVVRNAARLQDEILAWLRVQELITVHARTMSEIVGENLRVSAE
jgi:hypothetical protein